MELEVEQHGYRLPVGSYHVPFFGYPILVLGIYNHKFGYPKKGTWYEPTGIDL